MFDSSLFLASLQGSTKRRALGCEKFLRGLAWVVLSKTGPPFSRALYMINDFIMFCEEVAHIDKNILCKIQIILTYLISRTTRSGLWTY